MSTKPPTPLEFETEPKLLGLLSQLPIVMWTTDRQLCFTSSTGAGLEKLGLRPQQAIGTSMYEFFRTKDHNFPAIQAHLAALEGQSGKFEQEWLSSTFRSFVEPLYDAHGQIYGCLGIALDVTDSKAHEYALQRDQQRMREEMLEQSAKLSASHARLQSESAERVRTQEALQREQQFNAHIVSATPSLISALAPDGTTRAINPSVTKVLGYTPEEILGQNWWHLVYPGKDYCQVEQLFKDLEKGPVKDYPMVVTTKHGQKRTISWNSANRRDAGGNLTEIIGIGVDITAHKQLEKALRDRQQVLRQMLDAYERDRRLISMEIHDGLIQQMTGAVMQMQAADVKIAQNPTRAKEQLGQAVQMLRECIAEARRLMSGLRPPVLDEEGVVAAIDYLVQELRKEIHDVTFVNTTQFERLAAPLENTLFRITQESINNLRRHSHASQAAIRLSDEDHQIHLMVRDDGVGFDQKSVSPDRFGLKGIIERAELLGGSAHITSSPGDGTTVDVFLPKIDALE